VIGADFQHLEAPGAARHQHNDHIAGAATQQSSPYRRLGRDSTVTGPYLDRADELMLRRPAGLDIAEPDACAHPDRAVFGRLVHDSRRGQCPLQCRDPALEELLVLQCVDQLEVVGELSTLITCISQSISHVRASGRRENGELVMRRS
jgi:hypothetical protein